MSRVVESILTPGERVDVQEDSDPVPEERTKGVMAVVIVRAIVVTRRDEMRRSIQQ